MVFVLVVVLPVPAPFVVLLAAAEAGLREPPPCRCGCDGVWADIEFPRVGLIQGAADDMLLQARESMK